MICAACQNDVVVKLDNSRIKCNTCNATWYNRTAACCDHCVIGKLEQRYPNTIKCPHCGTKWYNNNLNQFGKNLKGYYSAKWKEGRK